VQCSHGAHLTSQGEELLEKHSQLGLQAHSFIVTIHIGGHLPQLYLPECPAVVSSAWLQNMRQQVLPQAEQQARRQLTPLHHRQLLQPQQLLHVVQALWQGGDVAGQQLGCQPQLVPGSTVNRVGTAKAMCRQCSQL